MGVTGSKLGGKDAGIRRSRSTHTGGMGERTTHVSGFCVIWTSSGARRGVICPSRNSSSSASGIDVEVVTKRIEKG
jgi:hypothetical protein